MAEETKTVEQVEQKAAEQGAAVKNTIDRETIAKIVQEMMAAEQKAHGFDPRIADVMLPPEELTGERKIFEVARNGYKNEAEKQLLVEEYFRHKMLGFKYGLTAKTPLPMVQKALTAAAAGAGAELVATEYLRSAIMALQNIAEFMPLVTEWQMGDHVLDAPILTNGLTGYMRNENTEPTKSDITTSSVTLTAKTMMILTNFISKEVIADSRTPLMPWLSQAMALGSKAKKQTLFAVGSDSTGPYGISYASYTGIAQAGSALAYDDIINLVYGVPQQYRNLPNGGQAFFANNSGIKLLRKIKDAEELPILVGATANKMATLLDWPLVELPDITGTGVTGSRTTIFFGAWKYGYYWGTREGISVEATDVGGDNFKQHSVQVKGVERFDGAAAVTDAVRKLTGCYM